MHVSCADETLLHCRKLGTLALEAVQTLVDASQNSGPAATAGNATESSGDSAALLDLTGDREFLTRETAEDALAAMLAENAALRKARCLQAGPHRTWCPSSALVHVDCCDHVGVLQVARSGPGDMICCSACTGTSVPGFVPVEMQIKLSSKSFGTDAAEVAAHGIANIISTLEEADLSDIIAGPSLHHHPVGPLYPAPAFRNQSLSS